MFIFKNNVCRVASTAGLQEQRTGSAQALANAAATGPGVSIILPHLKELLESVTLQQEAMREMVAAVSDTERGKQAALNTFIQQRLNLRPSSQELDKLRSEVNELREENAKLRAALRASGGHLASVTEEVTAHPIG